MSPYKQSSKRTYDVNRRLKSPAKGFHRGDRKAAEIAFEARSDRSKSQDLIRLAKIAPNISVYLKQPNRFDFPEIDTPDAKLIFKHKSRREQAADLAKLAKLAPIEVWIEKTNRYDIENVDTPPRGKAVPPTEQKSAEPKTVKRFQVIKKKVAEKLKLKPAREDAEKPTRKMPSKAEIQQRAKELYMEEQAKSGLPSITPETSELRENGLLLKAQHELMRGEDSKVESQVLEYVDQLKQELEPMGFSIVPIK
jgi:hypothetical protein